MRIVKHFSTLKSINNLADYDCGRAMSALYKYVTQERPELESTYFRALGEENITDRTTILTNLKQAVHHYNFRDDFKNVIQLAKQAERIKQSGHKWLNCYITKRGLAERPVSLGQVKALIINLTSRKLVA